MRAKFLHEFGEGFLYKVFSVRGHPFHNYVEFETTQDFGDFLVVGDWFFKFKKYTSHLFSNSQQTFGVISPLVMVGGRDIIGWETVAVLESDMRFGFRGSASSSEELPEEDRRVCVTGVSDSESA